METFLLACHHETPPGHVRSVEVFLERMGDNLWLRYHVDCAIAAIELPGPERPIRSDGLWRRTCFEAFIGSGSYTEFNFSPSSQWAAYDFTAYREGMAERTRAGEPHIALDASESHFALEAMIDITGLSGALALSAVIEEADGTKSYWALAHPPGKPDFHHPACFAATLPPPSNA